MNAQYVGLFTAVTPSRRAKRGVVAPRARRSRDYIPAFATPQSVPSWPLMSDKTMVRRLVRSTFPLIGYRELALMDPVGSSIPEKVTAAMRKDVPAFG